MERVNPQRDELTQVVARLHGGEPTWIESVAVCEQFGGRVVWQGVVEVFALHAHPIAGKCYAWSYEAEDGRRRYFAVLHSPPVDSPAAAVRAAVASDSKNR